MSVPVFTPLKKTDYGPEGLGSQPALDKFFNQLNTQNQALLAALNGGIDPKNLNGDSWEISVTTPDTDWTTATYTNSWVDFGSGFPGASYRKDNNGTVWIRGRVKNGTAGSAVFTLPVGYRPAMHMLVSVRGASAYASIQVAADTGAVSEVDGGNVDLSLYCSFPCADNSAGVYSCWPKQVRCADGKVVKDVYVTSVVDQDQATAPTIAPGECAWSPVQTKKSFPNSFQINNIAGLALGRSYKVRGWVLYA